MGHELNRKPKTQASSLFQRSALGDIIAERDLGKESFTRLRQDVGCCTNFAKFMYDKEHKTFMHRNSKHWRGLFVYYTLYLLTVVIFFAILILIAQRFMTDLRDREAAISKTSVYKHPLITFVPLGVDSFAEPLIWFGHSGDDTPTNRRGTSYEKAINEYIETEQRKCLLHKIDYCPIKKADYGPCGKDKFGYDIKQPCIFVKMTHLDRWAPTSFRNKKSIPANIPDHVKQEIDVKKEAAWVFCTGSTPYDREHIGNITYIPNQFFDEKFFPMKKADLINPIIAIQLKHIEPGYLLKLTCILLGGNVPEDVGADLNIYMRPD